MCKSASCSSCEEACFQQSKLDHKDRLTEEMAPGPPLQSSADSRLSGVWFPGCCGLAKRIVTGPLYPYRTYALFSADFFRLRWGNMRSMTCLLYLLFYASMKSVVKVNKRVTKEEQ